MSSDRIRIAAVGDVALIGRAAAAARERGTDWILRGVVSLLADADVTLFNLEMPFAPKTAPRPSHVPETFRADPALVKALKFPGIRIASLGNNHIMDFGEAGLECTRAALREEGILFGGAGRTPEEARRPVLAQVNGLRMGVLAYAREGAHSVGAGPGAAALRCEDVIADIAPLRSAVDLLVVQLHHGLTYVDMPTPEDRALVHAVIEAGADLVIGHHPHVLQGIEKIGRAFAAHSLGEFVFDGETGNVVARFAAEARRRTAVLIAEASSAGVTDARLVPVQISDEGLPLEPPAEAAARLHERFGELAALLQRPDYDSVFRERAAANLVGHETRVLFTALGRGDFSYLMTKASRIRWRHLGLLARNLRQRILRRRAEPNQRHG